MIRPFLVSRLYKPTNSFTPEKKIKSGVTETPRSPVSQNMTKIRSTKTRKRVGDDLYKMQSAQWVESNRRDQPEKADCFSRQRPAGRQQPDNNSEDSIQNIAKLCKITLIVVGKLKAVPGLRW